MFIFQGVLEEYFPPFTYFDEVVALVIFMSGIYYRYNVKKIAIEKWEWIIGLLTIVYSAVGLVSSIMYGYQSKVVSILSFYLSIKWFLLLMGIYNLGRASLLLDIEIINCKFLKNLVISITCWLISSLFLPRVFLRFPVHDFTAKCVFLLLCFICNQNIKNEKERLFYILWLIILLVSSGASKGYAISAFALGVYICLHFP